MQFYTPLRYPGGKGRLARFMKAVFKDNNLCDGTYIEPYAGGSAVALNLLFEEYAWRIVINDIDPLIYAFWYSVLNETEWLLRKIADTPVSIDNWHRFREVHKHPEDYSLREIGFATFFMNRTNRSGIIKAGVIGGQKQNGSYKMDARFNKTDLTNRIRKIALYRNRITLMNCDAVDILVAPPIAENGKGLIYLDPPYYHKGSMLYSNFYTHEDHASIASHVQELDIPWVLTYDNVPEINTLYQNNSRLEFTLTYSANESRKIGSEVMYYGHVGIPEEFICANHLHFKRAS